MTTKTNMPIEDATANRRNFLKFVGASAATGTTAVGTAAAIAAPAEPRAADALYQETEHVRRYYESTR